MMTMEPTKPSPKMIREQEQEEETVSTCEDEFDDCSSHSSVEIVDNDDGAVLEDMEATRTIESSSSPVQRPHRTVRWQEVHIHTHLMEMGDNPSVSGGVPITIGWKATQSHRMSIDDYEQHKESLEVRCKQEMMMPRMFRDDIARHSGASRSEMRQVEAEVKKIRENRIKSSKDGLWVNRFRILRITSCSNNSIGTSRTAAHLQTHLQQTTTTTSSSQLLAAP